MNYDLEQATKTVSVYPAPYIKAWPVVLRMTLSGVADPTLVEAELKLEETEESLTLVWDLFGPQMGMLLWRDSDNRPHASTMAEYNRRYWESLRDVSIPAESRPRRFVLADRFIGGDDDRKDWKEGIDNLTSVGFTTIQVPATPGLSEILRQAGVRTASAVYSPPGFTFATPQPGLKDPQSCESWAETQAKAYNKAGFAPNELGMFAMSDEPGWYYPSQYAMLENPEASRRFRRYLAETGLSAKDFGAVEWDSIKAGGRSTAKDLPSRRLFYWTQRFFSWDSANYYAECTKALEHWFYPGMPIATNWNFFSGRFYVPGPVAKNTAITDPDAGMGGHDWFEFGTLRGGTALWTEDWFADSQAYQWSFYAAKLRSATYANDAVFGGYVVGRATGEREEGLTHKILALIGSGAKVIYSYIFGPEYTFPGNCYSENPMVHRALARTYAMVGAAEDVLFPGKAVPSKVAILAPRSAQLWDASEIPVPRQIVDATNTDLNAATVDYMAEVADLYLALQHANVPVDFIDEDGLTAESLARFRVLYVTEPNIPLENQRAILNWMIQGGYLVLISNAGSRDRYDEPISVLSELKGLRPETERSRILIPSLAALKVTGRIHDGNDTITAWGVRDVLLTPAGETIASFDDGYPAVTRRPIGEGMLFHFAWLPGVSYRKTGKSAKGALPEGFSQAIRNWIVRPTQEAGIQNPVESSIPLVETPILLSDVGAAVTVLNWNNEPASNLELTIRTPFEVGSVKSVKDGELKFERNDAGGIRVRLAVSAGDILVLKPKVSDGSSRFTPQQRPKTPPVKGRSD